THVIRGDDHKINTFKQKQIYDAMKWKVPYFAHIPLIHSNEGKKLSKRDKASTIDDYIKIGILSDALRNYLLRLGWSFKDKEIFTLDESIEHFSLSGVGKSPSKLDMSRILSMNETYIKTMSEDKLYSSLIDYCKIYLKKIDNKFYDSLKKSLYFLKNKAKTLGDIYNNAQYIINDQINISPDDIKLLDYLSKKILNDFLKEFENLSNLSKKNLEKIVKGLIDKHKTNFKGVGQPLRIALTGSKFGPGIYDIVLSLDKNDAIKRLKAIN
ncbi:MAG: glutamate--tRNA ligase, partial [Pelagibacteraceae bacterium]|nr:glutamate--tRNA ligase [Pelagibacteraceae bacterium]